MFQTIYRSLNKHFLLCHESLRSWTQRPAGGTTWSVLVKPAFCHPAWAGTRALLNVKPTYFQVYDPRKKWCTGKASPGSQSGALTFRLGKNEEKSRLFPFLLKLGHRNAWCWPQYAQEISNCSGIYFWGGKLPFCPCFPRLVIYCTFEKSK